ncbi:MAG: PAS domain-containing protein, partial [Thermoanaerobaculia bacterium]
MSTENSEPAANPASTAGSFESSNELVRLLLDSTAEGIYGIDLKGNCTFANSACWKILGYECDADLLGKNMHALIHHTRPSGDPYPENECRIYQALRQSEGTHV